MSLGQVDLNLLVYLEALLAEANISRAAKRLHITQPALSNALARLRVLFGDDLLIRNGRQMELTTRARQLREPLAELLAKIDGELLARKAFDPTRDSFQFRTALRGYEEAILLPKIAQLLAPYPALSFLNRSPQAMHAGGDLRRGTIHFTATPSFEPQLLADEGLKTQKLCEDDYVCLAHSDFARHPAAQAMDLGFFCAQDHLLIAPYGGPGQVDQALAGLGLTRRVKVAVAEFGSVPLVLCRNPQLLTTIPRALAMLWVGAFLLVVLPCPVPLPQLVIYLMWHVSAQASPALQWLREGLVGG